jgi:hypothetical protein
MVFFNESNPKCSNDCEFNPRSAFSKGIPFTASAVTILIDAPGAKL